MRTRFLALILALVLSAMLIVLTNRLILADNAISPDEKAYLISAKLFSQGKLSTPSPPHKEFYSFNYDNVVNDGKYYGKYPPGWPFFLSLGLLLGLPMVVNLVFAVLTLAVVYAIGKEFYSHQTGLTAVLLMGTSPYIIYNSASYFSHAAVLFFITLFTYVYFRTLKSHKTGDYLLLGMTLGIAFVIRPVDAIAVGACFFVHYALTRRRQAKAGTPTPGRETVNAGFFILGSLTFIGLLLLYNHIQTGSALLNPFQKYNPGDTLSFSIVQSAAMIITSLLKGLVAWIPYSPLILFGIVLARGKRKNTTFLLFSILPALLAAYSLYVGSGGYQYGPRYLYASASALFLIMAEALAWISERNRRVYQACLILALLLNAGLFAITAPLCRDVINTKKAVYDTVVEGGISNAVVFLEQRGRGMIFLPMPAQDFTKDTWFFNDSVVYATDRGNENRLLTKNYPNRSYYLWKCRLFHERAEWLEFYHFRIINCTLSPLG